LGEAAARGQRFPIPPSYRLRAAARGDITRLGQIQIELETQMRPREIETLIRAGETVEHLAASAGIPEQRVERYAYPVLLERSRNAELAQHAHPVREDGPDVQTLGEVVAHAFGVRGQDYSRATWDSWRGDDGKWIVGLHWKAGRSDNRAHWVFSPGAHGGTVTAVDEPAEDLLNPHANRTPRTLRAVTREGAQDGARNDSARNNSAQDESARQDDTKQENTTDQPTLDSAANAGADSLSGKLDTDANRDVSIKYGISAIPTVILFKDGKVAKQFVGLRKEQDFKEAMDATV
jgi:hypothetical protein